MTLAPAAELAVRTAGIKIHDAEDFAGMRAAGRLAAECLDMLTPHMQPGAPTEHIDDLAREFILDHGALPACLGYRGYTRRCASRPTTSSATASRGRRR